ncbi:MAG: membrane integrity-associated transporter subunit PqiC [Asticcacaulis sp.]|nr:membrane integrity-associated transporter subunit PqiC [Asticcacaulis sp.]
MSHVRKAMTLAILTTAALVLGGCINVLPKTKPVQLYRFGYDAARLDSPSPTAAGVPVALGLGTVTFPPGSAGDSILTVEDNEVAYVAGARWTAASQPLFSEAVSEGFARSGGNIHLEPRPMSAPYRLDISVRRFESDYGKGKPTVSIAMDARITRNSDHVIVGQRLITADVGVKKNDMSLMADAYSQATTQVVSALVGFSQETLSPLAPPETPMTDAATDGKQKVEGL